MNQMLAFHNDKSIKSKYVKRVTAHYKADEIIQGKYWENGKGCAVGCTVEGSGNWHQRYEEELGISRSLARLQDCIFEGLTNGDAKQFPLQFLKSIEVGANLSMVLPKFFVWLLVDPKDGVIQYARPDGKKAIQRVADLYQKKIDGGKVTKEQWRTADSAAAYSAAYVAAAADSAAAYSAAYVAAAAAADSAAADSAAYSAAYVAAAAADSAAYSAAADSAAHKAAKQAHYQKMAKKLLKLLKEA